MYTILLKYWHQHFYLNISFDIIIIPWENMGNDYSLLNEYSVLRPSSLVGIWSPSLRGDQSDQRTRSQNTVQYKFNKRIIIYL